MPKIEIPSKEKGNSEYIDNKNKNLEIKKLMKL